MLSMRDYYHSFRRAGIPSGYSLLPYIIASFPHEGTFDKNITNIFASGPTQTHAYLDRVLVEA